MKDIRTLARIHVDNTNGSEGCSECGLIATQICPERSCSITPGPYGGNYVTREKIRNAFGFRHWGPLRSST